MIAPNDPFDRNPDPTDESQLIAGLRSGQEAAAEKFVREYSGRMLAVAARFLPCDSDRDDAVQDAFMCALRAIGAFKGDCRLSTWLHRIVVNACLMKLRSRSRRPELSIEEHTSEFDGAGRCDLHNSGLKDDAFERVAADETRELVRRCIEQLPDAYRLVLVMRDIEEMDTDQTARALGISTAAVKTRLHRARQALRPLLSLHLETPRHQTLALAGHR